MAFGTMKIPYIFLGATGVGIHSTIPVSKITWLINPVEVI